MTRSLKSLLMAGAAFSLLTLPGVAARAASPIVLAQAEVPAVAAAEKAVDQARAALRKAMASGTTQAVTSARAGLKTALDALKAAQLTAGETPTSEPAPVVEADQPPPPAAAEKPAEPPPPPAVAAEPPPPPPPPPAVAAEPPPPPAAEPAPPPVAVEPAPPAPAPAPPPAPPAAAVETPPPPPVAAEQPPPPPPAVETGQPTPPPAAAEGQPPPGNGKGKPRGGQAARRAAGGPPPAPPAPPAAEAQPPAAPAGAQPPAGSEAALPPPPPPPSPPAAGAAEGPPPATAAEGPPPALQPVQPPPAGQDGAVAKAADGRLILRQGGQLIIQHDESARFRQQGAKVFATQGPNGTTIETINRPNGVQIVTTRDPSGAILRRERRMPDGTVVVLIDVQPQDRQQVSQRMDYLRKLPPVRLNIPPQQYIVESQQASPEQIEQALLAPPVEQVEQPYTLDEIRRSGRLRDKIPRIDVDTITFDFGQASVPPDQIGTLNVIGAALREIIQRNPREVYLIEGHTDAVGSELANLALSDRRAESVAEILSYYYQIPPENLVTQGYGEQYLKVPTTAAERENRRVTLRHITPLLATGSQ